MSGDASPVRTRTAFRWIVAGARSAVPALAEERERRFVRPSVSCTTIRYLYGLDEAAGAFSSTAIQGRTSSRWPESVDAP
jgi:hypothetical protein